MFGGGVQRKQAGGLEASSGTRSAVPPAETFVISQPDPSPHEGHGAALKLCA